MKFIVAAASEEEARGVVAKEVVDGSIDWDDSECEPVAPDAVDECEIAEDYAFAEPRVLFRSGYFLY